MRNGRSSESGYGAALLQTCLQKRRSFWLYGLKGGGKSHRLRHSLEEGAVDGRASVRIVELYGWMSLEQWAQALFEALPGSQWRPRKWFDGDPVDSEEIWRQWCDAYDKVAADIYIVIDGWQWMPDELKRGGAKMIMDRGLSCGFVACAPPHSYLWADQIIKLDIIECPPLSRDDQLQMVSDLFEECGVPELLQVYRRFETDRTGHPIHAAAMARRLVEYAAQGEEDSFNNETRAKKLFRDVRRGLCQNLLEVFDEESLQAQAPMAYLSYPLPRHIVWRHFDRENLLPAIEYGMLFETFDRVSLARPLRGILSELLESTDQQWWQLLDCLWESYQLMTDGAIQGSVDHRLVQALVDVFGRACNAGELTGEKRTFLARVMSGIDVHFRVLLSPRRLPAALDALESIPPQLYGVMPAARFRLSQCLVMSGRRNEADKLLRGLLRMKNTNAGKRAFIWTQIYAAFEGDADEAVAKLTAFLDERIKPGEALDTLVRRVLATILTFRGFYRDALPIIEVGIRSARANNLVWDLHLLRNFQGQCLSLTGDRDAGLTLMHDACDTLFDLGLELAHIEARHRLMGVYLEHEQFDDARREMERIRSEYERFDDQRNLRMLDVGEHLIALYLGEDEPPPRSELDRTPAETEWPYYQADLSFAEALHAKRCGDEVLAIRKLKRALEGHLASGTVQALGRLLRHYLPLLLNHTAMEETRQLLSLLEPHYLEQRDFGATAGLLKDAILLTGNFGDWELVASLGTVTFDPTAGNLFPRCANYSPSPAVATWIDAWEELVRGADQQGDSAGLFCRSAEAAALYRAWAALSRGDVLGCRRALRSCQELDLAGSLFGFMRGLAHEAVDKPMSDNELSRHREILEFWHHLSPAMTMQQLRFWEGLLDRRRDQLSPKLVAALRPWLTAVQHWRVDQSMLIDETLGEVFFDGHRFHLGRDTVAFSVLCLLAAHETATEPVPIEELFESIWERPYSPPSSNSNVYVAIRTLRQALHMESRSESVIAMERGKGYSLDIPAVMAPRPGASQRFLQD